LKAPLDIYHNASKDIPPTLEEIGEQEMKVAYESFARAAKAERLEDAKREFDKAWLCLQLALERFESGGKRARDGGIGPIPTGWFN